MRFLIDSHIFLWATSDPGKLSSAAMRLLQEQSNEPLLSIASAWEITIKYSYGKLLLPAPPEQFLRDQIERLALELLPLELIHLHPLADLLFHYRDPFDRLIISQCLAENIPVLSADTAFDAYAGLTRLW